jgi:3-oxoacyl-[acyl-carrier-protein] synthase II
MNPEAVSTGCEVVVTGMSAVSPMGTGREVLINGLWSGEDGYVPVPEGQQVEGQRACRAALVRDFEPRKRIPAMKLRRMDNCTRFSIVAAEMAFEDAGLLRPGEKGPEPVEDLSSCGIFFGTGTAGSTSVAEYLQGLLVDGVEGQFPMLFPNTVPNAPAGQVAIRFGIRGPNATVSQREGSGLHALARAVEQIHMGRCHRALVVGVDEFSTELLTFYDRMGFLSPGHTPGAESCRPFSARRNGWMVGEGAYALVLESADLASRRGAGVLGRILGAGWSGSTCPTYRWPEDPEAGARAIRGALRAAGIEPGAVGAVMASANGNQVLDRMEALALGQVFGAAGTMPPVTAVKSLIGESGAGGVAQTMVALGVLESGSVPPTVGGEADDQGGPEVNLVTGQAVTLDRALEAVLVNSFASGGSNVSMVIHRA